MKKARTNWRNLPPKKMIRSMSPLRLAMNQWGGDSVKMDKIAEEMYKSILRGFWDQLLGHNVAKRGNCYEHTYTVKQEDEPHWVTVAVEGEADDSKVYRYAGTIPPEPTLKFELEMTNLPVSYALYNQLIVREPESYMNHGSTA